MFTEGYGLVFPPGGTLCVCYGSALIPVGWIAFRLIHTDSQPHMLVLIVLIVLIVLTTHTHQTLLSLNRLHAVATYTLFKYFCHSIFVVFFVIIA